MPDPLTSYELFDRVVNVREGYSVPLGLRGTVIGISPGSLLFALSIIVVRVVYINSRCVYFIVLSFLYDFYDSKFVSLARTGSCLGNKKNVKN